MDIPSFIGDPDENPMPTLSIVEGEGPSASGSARDGGRVDDILLQDRDIDHGAAHTKRDPNSTADKPEFKCRCRTIDESRNLVVCIDGTANQFSFQVRRAT